MTESELACMTLIKPEDFTPEVVGQTRLVMHNALVYQGVRVVRQLAPVWCIEAKLELATPHWELNAWGITDG